MNMLSLACCQRGDWRSLVPATDVREAAAVRENAPEAIGPEPSHREGGDPTRAMPARSTTLRIAGQLDGKLFDRRKHLVQHETRVRIVDRVVLDAAVGARRNEDCDH